MIDSPGTLDCSRTLSEYKLLAFGPSSCNESTDDGPNTVALESVDWLPPGTQMHSPSLPFFDCLPATQGRFPISACERCVLGHPRSDQCPAGPASSQRPGRPDGGQDQGPHGVVAHGVGVADAAFAAKQSFERSTHIGISSFWLPLGYRKLGSGHA